MVEGLLVEVLAVELDLLLSLLVLRRAEVYPNCSLPLLFILHNVGRERAAEVKWGWPVASHTHTSEGGCHVTSSVASRACAASTSSSGASSSVTATPPPATRTAASTLHPQQQYHITSLAAHTHTHRDSTHQPTHAHRTD